MDIQGLVNHSNWENTRYTSLSPPDNSSTESARSQIPIDSTRSYALIYPNSHRDHEGLQSPRHPLYYSNERTISPPIKRAADLPSPTFPAIPTKRRLGDTSGEHGKSTPTRRRALQACEVCRAKKSKCDNERPSCGACIQHGLECVYKGAPLIPVYTYLNLMGSN